MSRKQISPLCQYMGNKIKISNWIVPMFGDHKRYVELFGGTASILLNKPKSHVEVYNDKNLYMSNLFETIITHRDEFIDRITKWNLSEVRYNDYHDVRKLDPDGFPDIEAALKYFYILKLCGYGKFNGGFYLNIDKSGEELFAKSAKDIIEFERRMKGVLIYSRDFEKIIKAFGKKGAGEQTVIYADPPYKNTEEYYEHITGKFTDDDHVRLRDALIRSHCTWFVSYEYDDFIHSLYADLDNIWVFEKNKTRPAKKGMGDWKAKEILITNTYPEHNFLFSSEEMRKQSTVKNEEDAS